jgi:hypothetical protein
MIFYIVLSWLIISIFAYGILRWRDDGRMMESHKYLSALTGSIIIFNGAIYFLVPLLTGYLAELLSFLFSKKGSFIYFEASFLIFGSTLSLLNFWSAFRRKNALQYAIFGLFTAFVIVSLLADLSEPIPPGWHTSFAQDFSQDYLVSFLALGLSLNLVIVFFRLLPELNDE